MNNRWIKVTDKLPNHLDIVLVHTANGNNAVVKFLNSEEVNKVLKAHNIEPEPSDDYVFASQELSGNVLNNATHWMYIEPPILDEDQ